MTQVSQTRPGLRRGSLALLLAGLLVPLTTAKADVLTFNLFGAPSAVLDEESPGAPNETIQLTGGGTFDPDTGAVHASGSAVVFNAVDHPAPPLGATIRGTWTATSFLSFTPDEPSGNGGKIGGTLMIKVHFDLALGAIQPNATLIVMEDGIAVTGFGPDGEEFDLVEGTGGAGFNVHGKAEAP